MTSIRQPAVAGLFYPAGPNELRGLVRRLLDAAPASGARPKAMILPHAGLVYSGPVAATGYRRLEAIADSIERVVLIGPAHRIAFRGIVTHSADVFATPLGPIHVDPGARDLPGVGVYDHAHDDEHSLEVHLPFLQVVLGDFLLVPLLVGQAHPDEVAAVLEAAWGGPETVVIVSSDLSHFHDHDTAQERDRATARAIEALDIEGVGPHDACGCRGVGGLLEVARRRELSIATLDLRNSGDTFGPHERVVGYGAFAVEEAPAASGA